MDLPQAGPGEELNTGPETPPRLAATVIILHQERERMEVLLVQRNPSSRFMGGAWVFPGGAVAGEEGSDDAAIRAAAVRECQEEAGLDLKDPGQLVPFSRWITPAEVKIRFDTWFFLSELPAGQAPRIDGQEIVAFRWLEPAEALREAAENRLLLVFPTIKHLEQLASFRSVGDLMEYARTRKIVPVQPKVVGSGETARILLPGEEGYNGDGAG